MVRSNGQPGQSGARPSRPGAPAPQNGADQAKESLRNRLGLGQKEQPSGAAGGSRNGAQSSAGSPNRPVVRAAGNRQPGTPVARANPSQSAGTSQPTANQPTATQAAVTRTGSSPEPRSGAGRPDTGVRSGVAAPQARAGTPSSPSGVSATRSGSPTTIGTARSAGSPTERSRDLGLPEAKPKAGQARRTRKARLRLSRLDPWSVMKTSFLFSISAGIVLVVAVYAIWTVL
ncbi:MAG TPA: DUF3566 domain-containing protein, partial [Microlunatus sp.]|nr:DUF3566 domain-containing protein [Microlunatus sp.]